MPKVTKISKQRRSDNRYNIYVDNKYEFALSDLDLSTSGLRVGEELTDVQVQQFQDQAQQAKAYALALRYLSYRPRSEREMRDYLKRKAAAPEEIEAAVGELTRLGLLDDAAFAEAWVRNRQMLRPRSRRRLEQELAAKGVGREAIEAAVATMDGDEEVAALADVIERKRRLPQYREAEKLMAYLARQGYRYDTIKKALERLED